MLLFSPTESQRLTDAAMGPWPMRRHIEMAKSRVHYYKCDLRMVAWLPDRQPDKRLHPRKNKRLDRFKMIHVTKFIQVTFKEV